MIERLKPPVCEADLRSLALLLVDAVESGAIFLVARDAEGIVGTVQLHPAWAPNQPYRADVMKLLVHRRGRRSGIGTQLMHSLETEARAAGFHLLTLDSRRGDAAEGLYRRLGWTTVGTIPRYALDPDGITPHDTVVFYKELAEDNRSDRRP